MKTRYTVLASALILALALPALAQETSATTITAPDYASSAMTDTVSTGQFTSPEADGRPGVYYFVLGANAFRKHDYQHAIDMYKVSASWAYKPAEYDLGLMYFKGEGVPEDRARGAAWMILAAERGNTLYVKARNLMVTALTDSEFKRTDKIWNQLKPTYADAVALKRAQARWHLVKTSATGSHLGAVASEYVQVGGGGHNDPGMHGSNPAAAAVGGPPAVTGADIFKSGQVMDGSVAYQQFQQSDNPYSSAFTERPVGAVDVEPLQLMKPASDKTKKKTKKHMNKGSSQPSQLPRNA